MSVVANIFKAKNFYTKNNFTAILGTSATRVINLVIGFLSSILVARCIGPEGRGHLAFLLAVALTLSQFLSLGIPSMNTYMVSKNPCDLKKNIANSLFLLIPISILVVLVLYGIFPFFFESSGRDRLFVFIFVFFNLASLFFSSCLLGLMRISLWNKLELFKSATYIFICLFLIFFEFKDCIYFFIASLLSLVAHTLFSLAKLINFRELLLIWGAVDFFSLKNFSTFLIKNHIATFLAYLMTRINFFIIPFFLNEKTLGLYATAYSFIEVFLIFSSSIHLIMYPKMCKIKDDGEKRDIIFKALKYFFLFSLSFMFFVYFTIDQIVLFMYGLQFGEASQMVVHLLPSFLFLSMVSILSSYVASLSMHRIVVYAPFISVVFFAISLVPLLSSFGLYGLIWCLNASYVVYFLVYALFLNFNTSREILLSNN